MPRDAWDYVSRFKEKKRKEKRLERRRIQTPGALTRVITCAS